MNKFFEESKQRDILAQWQRKTQLRLHEVRKEHEANAKHECRMLISGRQALAKADNLLLHRYKAIQLAPLYIPNKYTIPITGILNFATTSTHKFSQLYLHAHHLAAYVGFMTFQL